MRGAQAVHRESGTYKLAVSNLPRDKKRCREIVSGCPGYVSYTIVHTRDWHSARVTFHTEMDALRAWDVLAKTRVRPPGWSRADQWVQVKWAVDS